jgi:MraZ protein
LGGGFPAPGRFAGVAEAAGNLRVALFASTFFNKIDRKGRVSVPAPFRAALMGQPFAGIVAFRSLKYSALDAGGYDQLEEIAKSLDELPGLSDERDALASMISDAHQLPFDSEGRVGLPQSLLAYAGIHDNVAFVGIGHSFQIWDPEAFHRHQDEMRDRVRQRGFTLPPRSPR